MDSNANNTFSTSSNIGDLISFDGNNTTQTNLNFQGNNHPKVEAQSSFIKVEESPYRSIKKSMLIDFDMKSVKGSVISSNNSEDYLPIKDFDYNENFMFLESKFTKIDAWLNEGKENRNIQMKLYQDIRNSKLDNTCKNIDQIPNVGPVSTLEYMVESSISAENPNELPWMHLSVLDDHIFRWRSVLGDGNCFYRSVIFAYLEQIVFQKDVIALKKIMVEINDWFDASYINTKLLQRQIKDRITSTNKELILRILYLIIEFLDKPNSKTSSANENIFIAYEILLKGFNCCIKFDHGMVLYYRYCIYEYLLKHKDKLYTTEFTVKIGNLLPGEYETESGDFLFNRFFNEYLLNMFVDAEKIIVYLTPFILKVNLNILIYEFGMNFSVEEKSFPCYLSNKPKITLLYRQIHYDLLYQEEYFEMYGKFLCYYVHMGENLSIIKQDMLESIRSSKRENKKLSNEKNIRTSQIAEMNPEDYYEGSLSSRNKDPPNRNSFSIFFSSPENDAKKNQGVDLLALEQILSVTLTDTKPLEQEGNVDNQYPRFDSLDNGLPNNQGNNQDVSKLGNQGYQPSESMYSINPNQQRGFVQSQYQPNNQQLSQSNFIHNNPNNKIAQSVYNNQDQQQYKQPPLYSNQPMSQGEKQFNNQQFNQGQQQFNQGQQLNQSQQQFIQGQQQFNQSQQLNQGQQQFNQGKQKFFYNQDQQQFNQSQQQFNQGQQQFNQVQQQFNQGQKQVINQGRSNMNQFDIADPSNANEYQLVNDVVLKCFNCDKSIEVKHSSLNLCDICAHNELVNFITSNFNLYNKEKLKNYNLNDNEDFWKRMSNLKILINNYKFAIFGLSKITNFNLQGFIGNLRSITCICCSTNINQNSNSSSPSVKIILPCFCVLCSNNCLLKHVSSTLFFPNNQFQKYVCVCTRRYSIKEIRQLYDIGLSLQNRDITKSATKILRNTMINTLGNLCFTCFIVSNNRNPIILRKVEMIDTESCKILERKSFIHLICDPCQKNYKLFDGMKIECIYCNLTHTVKRFRNKEQNESDCLIF